MKAEDQLQHSDEASDKHTPTETVPVYISLQRRYILALLLIAISLLMGVMVSDSTAEQQRMDATVINLAGRQRMLSQRITKLAYELQISDKAGHQQIATRLHQQISTFTTTQNALRVGSSKLGLPGEPRLNPNGSFSSVTANASRIRASALALVDAARGDGILDEALFVELTQAERSFLPAMDALVFTLEREAVNRVDSAREFNYARLAISFLILLAEVLFIFQPAVRRIKNALGDLQAAKSTIQERNNRLEEVNTKLEETLVHVLRGLHPICVGCKSIKGQHGEWIEVSEFLSQKTNAKFSHGLCEPCAVKMYPELAEELQDSTLS